MMLKNENFSSAVWWYHSSNINFPLLILAIHPKFFYSLRTADALAESFPAEGIPAHW
jgi:hypothetical protein